MTRIDGTEIFWEYDKTCMTLRFEGVGSLPDYLKLLVRFVLSEGVSINEWKRHVHWNDYYDEIKIIKGEGILIIPPALFAWMQNLAVVRLPKVKIVGNSAFYLDKKLECLDMPEVALIGTSAFEHSKSLKSSNGISNKLVFPKLRHISSFAFRGCKSISSISLIRKKRITDEGIKKQETGSELEFIGEYAFADCLTLTESRFFKGRKSSRTFIHERAFPETYCRNGD